jgi:peroxiredoxin
MSSANRLLKNSHLVAVALLCLLVAACGNNLVPSGEDKRPTVEAGTAGPAVSQAAPDFTVTASDNTSVTLAAALAGKKGIVLYFTMWCPICDSHMNNLRATIVPLYPDVGFFLVDYVSGSVAAAADAAAANGYAGGRFTILADTGQTMLGSYRATMGTTVVIDKNGIVRLNEDYRDGLRLQAVLAALP